VRESRGRGVRRSALEVGILDGLHLHLVALLLLVLVVIVVLGDPILLVEDVRHPAGDRDRGRGAGS
jgi:hypothetical protein